MVSICISMELLTLEIGQMINKTGMVKRHGPMEQFTKVFIRMELNMEKAAFNGLTEQHIMVNSLTTTLRAKEYTFGLIRENMKEAGSIIKWMEQGYLFGLTVDHTSGNIKMIRSKELGIFDGLMVESIKVNGTMVFSTAMENTQTFKEMQSTAFGNTADEKNGSKDENLIKNLKRGLLTF